MGGDRQRAGDARKGKDMIVHSFAIELHSYERDDLRSSCSIDRLL
jgi:hypothetical protein